MQFYIFLFMGMLLMLVCMMYAGKTYQIPAFKSAISAVILTAVGYYGAKIMFAVESGGWSGRSLYGAIFLAPLLMFPFAKLLRIEYGHLMDICAPAECIMLSLLKVKCKIDGCCYVRMLTIGGNQVQFPSQIVECVFTLILMFILLRMIKRGKYENQVYYYYMVFYGVGRFILNLLRETTPWILGMAAGNFWSILSILIGVLVIVLLRRKAVSKA